MDEIYQLRNDQITRWENLILVYELSALGDEIWGLSSQAGWAGRLCGAQRAAKSWLYPRTAVSGRSGSVLCWVSGRGAEGSQACGQEPHSQTGKWAQHARVLGILVPIPTSCQWDPNITTSDTPNADRPSTPPQGRAPDPFYNLVGWRVQSYFLRV